MLKRQTSLFFVCFNFYERNISFLCMILHVQNVYHKKSINGNRIKERAQKSYRKNSRARHVALSGNLPQARVFSSHLLSLMGYGVVVSMFDFHRSDRGSNPGRGGKLS